MWVHYGALIIIGFDVAFKSCQEPQIPKDAAYFPWHGLRFSPGVVKTRATCLDLDLKIGTCLREVLLPKGKIHVPSQLHFALENMWGLRHYLYEMQQRKCPWTEDDHDPDNPMVFFFCLIPRILWHVAVEIPK